MRPGGTVAIEAVEAVLKKYGAISQDPADPVAAMLRAADGHALGLFAAALTHSTIHRAEDMEMMELIGDSVVNCVAIAEVLRRRPELVKNPSGIVFRIMNDITSSKPLADIALETGIGRLVRSREQWLSDAVLEDSVEAFVGALVTLTRLAPAELRPLFLQRAESFTAAILARTVDEQLARAESLRFNTAAYLKTSERAGNILTAARTSGVSRYEIKVSTAGGMYYPRVVEMGDVGGRRAVIDTVLRGAPDRDLAAAKENVNNLIIENSHVFGVSDAVNEAGALPDLIEDPLSPRDEELVAFVERLWANKTPVPLSAAATPGLAQTLRAAFTDARLDPTRANSSFLNMFGDRLLKMYLLTTYIPSRFPLRISSDAVHDINMAASRVSQARGSFVRRLGLARFMRFSDRAIGSNYMGLRKMMDYTFSALLAAGVYHTCGRFSGMRANSPGMVADAVSFMTGFLEPLLDSVDLTSVNPSWHVNGRAFAYRMVSRPMPESSRRSFPVQIGEDRVTVTEVSNVPPGANSEEMRFYGRGVGRNAAIDDMDDSYAAYLLNHPFRSTLDPGVAQPSMFGEFQLVAPARRKQL